MATGKDAAKLAGARVSTIIFMPLPHPQREEQQLKAWMRSCAIQFIQLFGAGMKEYSSVLIDDVGRALLGTRNLLENGHGRILMIGDGDRTESFYRVPYVR